MSRLNMTEEMFINIFNGLNIKNAFDDWTEYRNSVTEWIINETKENKTVAIWGAGNCNDIDLYKLSSHFSKIYLIDINEDAMNKSLIKYGLETRGNIFILVQDFMGLTKQDYLNYIDIAMQDLKRQKSLFSPFSTAQKMVKELDNLYIKVREHKIDIEDKVFDYSIVLGVHSQLNSLLEHIWKEFLMASGKNEFSVTKRVHRENDFIAKKFNEVIINSTKENIFMGLEKCECGLSDSIQGVMQAKDDLSQRCARKEIGLHEGKDVFWNFNPRMPKAYIMELINVEVLEK